MYAGRVPAVPVFEKIATMEGGHDELYSQNSAGKVSSTSADCAGKQFQRVNKPYGN